jgi:hypothetical protein
VPLSEAEIQAKIDALEARLTSLSGVTEATFADQTTKFSVEDAHKELARLNQLLTGAATGTGSSTRYAVTSKGC